MNNYETNLGKNDANFVPLTPLSFLERAKDIYPNYEALVYEDRSYSWRQVYKRCIKFASALEKIGIGKGDTVSVMAFNTPEIFEAHYSVPMTGAVLNTITVGVYRFVIGCAWINRVVVIIAVVSVVRIIVDAVSVFVECANQY